MFAAKRNLSPLAMLLASTLLAGVGAPGLAQSLPPCSEGSTGLVLSVTPASHSASISRGGSSASLQDLTMLCPGDMLSLGGGETALVDIQGGRSSSDPLVGPTSYQVPGAAGMMDNASVAVANLLFPEASTRTRTLVSRSDGAAMSPRPENLGVRLPQELAVSETPRSLWFGWSGGAAPFHVTLEDSAGSILAEAEVTAAQAAAIRASHTSAEGVVEAVPYDVTFAPVSLPAGDYRIRVADANSEPPEVAALMSDEDAGVMSMPLAVVDGLDGVPSRGASASEIDVIVEAMCFSLSQPESRLFEAAQHVVHGRDGAPYATTLSLLGSNDQGQAALCE